MTCDIDCENAQRKFLDPLRPQSYGAAFTGYYYLLFMVKRCR